MPGETLVIKRRGIHGLVCSLLCSAALAGCGGSAGTAPVAPSTSPRAAVDQFMQAVADSNLQKMAGLWGTAAGSAAKTGQPPDYERRILVMQAYLKNEGHKIVSDAPDASPDRHQVQVELRRQLCTKVVPFTVIKTADGSWVVNQVDLAAAGNPARPCLPGNEQDTTSAP
jgi:hypothetical protein